MFRKLVAPVLVVAVTAGFIVTLVVRTDAQGTLVAVSNVVVVSEKAGEVKVTWDGGDNATTMTFFIGLAPDGVGRQSHFVDGRPDSFTFAGLSAGRYVVTVAAAQHGPNGENFRSTQAESEPISVSTGYAVIITAGANGTTDPPPGRHGHASGDGVIITALPDPGYAVGSWGNDCSTLPDGSGRRDGAPTCFFTMGDDDVTASITFVPTCATGGAIADGITKPQLSADCEHLLAAKDTLRGTGALNWSNALPIAQWRGVVVAGDPPRVTKLKLGAKGLTGQLTGHIGFLTGLRELRLRGNTLTGVVPSNLGQLVNLTHVYLGKNTFVGCVPPHLRTVANNDISDLSLSDCAQPRDLGDIPIGELIPAGTYRIPDSGLIIDIPEGSRLTIEAWIRLSGARFPDDGIPRSGFALSLKHMDSESYIAFDRYYGHEMGRVIDPSLGGAGGASGASGASGATESVGTIFDVVIGSAWSAAE